jgi:nicotinate phosphoribosyltransferase
MAFDTELESFQAYAQAMPNNCIFLVDTYNSLAGVRRAVRVGHWLRDNGHELVGIRLDSGDFVQLGIEARTILDEAGFPETFIVGSNDLDEHAIARLKAQGSPINVWGIGTKLVTADDQPALGGVYKLSAVRSPGKPWQYKVKLSEEDDKTTTPGILQVRRYQTDGAFVGDTLYDTQLGLADSARRTFSDRATGSDLLLPVFRAGKAVYTSPAPAQIRQRVQDQLGCLALAVKRLSAPQPYPLRLEPRLADLKRRLIRHARAYAD